MTSTWRLHPRRRRTSGTTETSSTRWVTLRWWRTSYSNTTAAVYDIDLLKLMPLQFDWRKTINPQGFLEFNLWIERICATVHIRMKNIIFIIAAVYCVIRYDDQCSPGWAGSHQMVTRTAPLQSCVSVMSKYSLFFNVTIWGASSSAHQQYLVIDTGVHYYLQVYNPRLGHCTGGHYTILCTGHSHINTVPQ